MLAKHPTREGWLIITPEIEALLEAQWRLVTPDNEMIPPINAYAPDFLPGDVEKVRVWILTQLNVWRGEMRAKFGLTSAAFQELCYTGKALEAQRWLLAQDTLFGLFREAQARGISNLEMARLVLGQWQAWQAASDLIEAIYILIKMRLHNTVTIDELSQCLVNLPRTLEECEAFYARG